MAPRRTGAYRYGGGFGDRRIAGGRYERMLHRSRFYGLGAPYWNQDARGCIVGLTRGVNDKHIVRAVLESIAYQTADVLQSCRKIQGSL